MAHAGVVAHEQTMALDLVFERHDLSRNVSIRSRPQMTTWSWIPVVHRTWGGGESMWDCYCSSVKSLLILFRFGICFAVGNWLLVNLRIASVVNQGAQCGYCKVHKRSSAARRTSS